MSLSINFTDVLTFASGIFNALWPIFVIPLGLVFAFGLIGWIYKMISDKLSHPGSG